MALKRLAQLTREIASSVSSPTSALPASFEQHPVIKRYEQKRTDLAAGLAAAGGALDRLLAERAQLQEQHYADGVAALIAEDALLEEAGVDSQARLAALEEEIARATSRVRQHNDALRELAGIAHTVRDQVTIELRELVRLAARDVINQQLKLYASLIPLRQELERLHSFGVLEIPIPFFQATAMLDADAIHAAAREFGCGLTKP